MANRAAQFKSSSYWTENLQELNLVSSTLQKTNLGDLGSYYCSPSFFRTWSRKLAIDTSKSLASIFSNSLGSFLETKNFFNNKHLSVFCLQLELISMVTLTNKLCPSTLNCKSFCFFAEHWSRWCCKEKFRTPKKHLTKKTSHDLPLIYLIY